MQPTPKLADGLRRYPQKVSRPVSYRLLISYNDFRQASQIARYILKHRLQAKVDRLRGERRYRVMLLWQALNCAMVVAYCRPFPATTGAPPAGFRIFHVVSWPPLRLRRGRFLSLLYETAIPFSPIPTRRCGRFSRSLWKARQAGRS